MKLSIIIPVYNEEKTIATVIEQIKAVELPNEMTKEIVIVNDGSSDKTREILDVFGDEPLVAMFHLEKNSGKTTALALGLQKASGDILMIQDADLEYHPNNYPALLKPILAGEVKVVYGSRFKGTIEKMRWINRFANVVSNIVFNLLYGTKLTDINTCFKVFKREVLDGITIQSKNFTFETEITAKMKHRNVSILEIPISYTARTNQEGKKIAWATALEMFWGIVKYRFYDDTKKGR